MLCQSCRRNAIQAPATLARRLLTILTIHNANSSQETLNWGGREGWYRKSSRIPRLVPLFCRHERSTGLFLGKTDFSLRYASSSSWHSCPEKYPLFQMFSGSSDKWGHLLGLAKAYKTYRGSNQAQQQCGWISSWVLSPDSTITTKESSLFWMSKLFC